VPRSNSVGKIVVDASRRLESHRFKSPNLADVLTRPYATISIRRPNRSGGGSGGKQTWEPARTRRADHSATRASNKSLSSASRRVTWLGTIEQACFAMQGNYNRVMATITEIEKLARNLSEKERAVLAAHLLESLPPVLHDEDEGIAEALRRDAELEANPAAGLLLEELDQRIERRRTFNKS